MPGATRDVFVCHASEDKEEVVRPIVEACNQEGISCWVDEAEIQWGDSITQKVNEGLAQSRYVVVVLSRASATKSWPQRELNAVLNQEASIGEVKILPLLVGSERDRQEILGQFPLLNDKRHLPWGGDLREIVSALRARLGKAAEGSDGEEFLEVHTPGIQIPLPKIHKTFSQRDKDIFLRNAFVVVKRYFQDALQELERTYQEVELADGKERMIQHMTATTFWHPDGTPMSAAQFMEALFGKLPEFFKNEDELRALWSDPDTRSRLLDGLAENGFGKEQLEEMRRIISAEKSDIFDVLAFVAYASSPLTREERADRAKLIISTHFNTKQQVFLDFVLSHYVRVGVEELDKSKLTQLLRLRYQDSISDAVADLGSPEEIGQMFVGFQKWLYEREAA